MSKKIKGIKLQEEPSEIEKTAKWYTETEYHNPRLPLDFPVGDLLASGCVCDCDVIKEVYAEKLADYLLAERMISESLSFTIRATPEAAELVEQMKRQTIEPKKKEVRIPLEFKNLCELQCSTLTNTVVWERTKALMEDYFIRYDLHMALVEQHLTDEELEEALPFIKARAKETVKGFRFPTEARIIKDGKGK